MPRVPQGMGGYPTPLCTCRSMDAGERFVSWIHSSVFCIFYLFVCGCMALFVGWFISLFVSIDLFVCIFFSCL